MRAIRVLINGRQTCIAGLNAAMFVGAHVTIFNEPDSSVSLSITGIQGNTMLNWSEVPLVVGSEVTIQVVEVDTTDEPTKVKFLDMTLFQRLRLGLHLVFSYRDRDSDQSSRGNVCATKNP